MADVANVSDDPRDRPVEFYIREWDRWQQIAVDHMMEIGAWYGFAASLMGIELSMKTRDEFKAAFDQYVAESILRGRALGVAPDDASDARRKAIAA